MAKFMAISPKSTILKKIEASIIVPLVSFNCVDDAKNNIDTKGQDFTFTVRYYGVTEPVIRANTKDAVPNPYNPMHMVTEVTK